MSSRADRLERTVKKKSRDEIKKREMIGDATRGKGKGLWGWEIQPCENANVQYSAVQ